MHNTSSPCLNTPANRLEFYAATGNLEMVKRVVENGADPTAYNSYALYKAIVKQGNLDVIQYLVSKNADPRVDEDKALIHACLLGNLEVVMYLVGLGADPCASDNSPTFWAAYNGHLELLKFLIASGGYMRTDESYTSRRAAETGRLDVLMYMFDLGLNVNMNIQGEHPIISAVNGEHLNIVKFLVSKGADITENNYEAVRVASTNNSLEIVKYFIEIGVPLDIIKDARQKKYLAFCERMTAKKRERAQKIIYFWWIPICYNTERECGKRMAQHSLDAFNKLTNSIT